MKVIQVSKATGHQLDWLVAKCEGRGDWYLHWWNVGGDKRLVNCEIQSSYSNRWDLMGPIIDREEITIDYRDNETQARVFANFDFVEARAKKKQGLIAAARCYVLSKLGETVEVPEELD